MVLADISVPTWALIIGLVEWTITTVLCIWAVPHHRKHRKDG